MKPTAISTTQPIIDHSYSAIVRAEGRNEPAEILVVYRGYEDGRYIIHDGRQLYRADRSSPEDQEPIFIFNYSDIIETS